MKESLLKLLIAAAAVFAPIKGMLITCMLLISADLVLGIVAAHKRGEKITSAGLRRTITKILVYEAAIMLAYLSQHFMLSDNINIVNIVSGYIGMTELMSVMENLNSASGQNLLNIIIKKLGSVNDESKL